MRNFKVGALLTGVVLMGGLAVIPNFIEKVPAGTVGVVYNTQGVQKDTLSNGWHVVGFFDKVIEYPTRLQTVKYKDLEVVTKDSKSIKMDISFAHKVDPKKAVSLYETFGNVALEDIEGTYIETRMLEAARNAVSQYNLLDVYGEKANEIKTKIQESFTNDIATLGFIVSDVAMGAPKPDAKTQEAIDARMQASQENERKKLELENDKIEAERKKVQAQGEADKLLIEAKAEADALKLKAKEITTNTLQKEWIEKWDGKLPTIQSGEGSGLFIDASTLVEKK